MKRVLVVGDIILDRYTFVETTRKAEESQLPVWDTVREEYRLGGAGNVANNLKSLGKSDIEVSVFGLCDSATESLFRKSGIHRYGFQCGGIEKHRYVDVSTEKQIMRVDNAKKFDPIYIRDNEKRFEELFKEGTHDAIILSDYDKGSLTEKMVDIIRQNRNKLTVVDSKRQDLRMFDGLNVLKVNEKEYSAQVSSKLYGNFTEFFDSVVVTKGSKGASLLQCEKSVSDDRKYTIHRQDFPVRKVSAVDVTGCGDTHTAAMTFSLLRGDDIRDAITFANECASVVVQKFGTSVV